MSEKLERGAVVLHGVLLGAVIDTQLGPISFKWPFFSVRRGRVMDIVGGRNESEQCAVGFLRRLKKKLTSFKEPLCVIPFLLLSLLKQDQTVLLQAAAQCFIALVLYSGRTIKTT